MSKISKIALITGLSTLFALSASAQTIVRAEASTPDSIKVGKEQTVNWSSEHFPKGAFVHINLIEKVSDSPNTYELVRRLAEYSVNDGNETWVPERVDMGKELYIEVTCAGATRFPDGCSSALPTSKFAVESSFGSNLANIYTAFVEFLGSVLK